MENYALTYSLSQKPHCLPLTHSRGRYEENLFWGSAGGTWTPHDAVALWLLPAWKRVRRTTLLTIGIDTEYSPGIVRRRPYIADFDPFKDFQCCCPTTFRIMGVSSIVSINGA
ncbi:unnamed protein product [Sphagnum jensenii]|uniref:Uncharacterized protein n=1 Tax=Sphagnum jensenii TaxID=128206 RepID=A0ABP1BKW4_9BRYO